MNLLSCQSFEQIIVGGVPDDDGPGAGVPLQELLGGHRAVPDINVAGTRPRHHLTGVCPPTSCIIFLHIIIYNIYSSIIYYLLYTFREIRSLAISYMRCY